MRGKKKKTRTLRWKSLALVRGKSAWERGMDICPAVLACKVRHGGGGGKVDNGWFHQKLRHLVGRSAWSACWHSCSIWSCDACCLF
jgi:hypothetical protein